MRLARTFVSSLSIAAVIASSAFAQPAGAPPGAPQPYAPPPYPPPLPNAPVPYAYAYAPPQPLTEEEQALLARGEISDGQQLGGAALAFFVGFGLGQAAQGRWSDTGWIFTVGELASMSILFYGIGGAADDVADDVTDMRDRDCRGCATYIVIGAIAFAGLRLWGTIDAFAGPSSHNARVREIRMKAGIPMPFYAQPYVAPVRDGGGVAGVTLRF